jgi:two-component system, chemotaxis family, protein-glutamate methylesterase/glutaminase
MPLKELSRPWPPSLQSALIVLHISPTHASLLPDVLSRAGPLPAEHGRDGTRMERGPRGGYARLVGRHPGGDR